jgi:hypothetical protein
MNASPSEPTPESTAEQGRISLGGMIFGHAVLFIFCVALPAIMTGAAPVSTVALTRVDGRVSAKVAKCILFIVPYSRTTIYDVTSVGDRFVAGSATVSRNPSGGSRSVQTEDSAYLTIEGATGSVKVEVSPVNVKGVLEKAGAFLEDSSRTNLRFTVVANWKFGVFAGGLLSFLTVFYLYLQIGSLVRWLVRST